MERLFLARRWGFNRLELLHYSGAEGKREFGNGDDGEVAGAATTGEGVRRANALLRV